MAEDPVSTIFKDCTFAIITSSEINSSYAAELRDTLKKNAAGQIQIIASGSVINLDDVTHIISNTSDFALYPEARLQMVPVVTTSWIQASLIRQKQAQIRPYTPDPKLFFNNVTITCGDIPSGDKDAIVGAVLAMGGSESSSLTKLTTHICALTMNHPKCEQAMQNRNLKVKIVLPHWFDDCLKLGKRIDEKPYLLPDPEIWRTLPDADLPIPSSVDIEGATSAHPEYFQTPTDSPSMKRLTVFKGKTIMLSEDLGIGNRIRKILEDLIVGGGGSITTSVHRADIFVCRNRSGRDYVFASRAGIDVGNLAWIYHLITHNEWTSPLRRLLHYPLPEDGIPGFKDFRITLSNYGGEARIYLENLVVAAGGEFTKSMKQDNTHLITARKTSEKCAAAEEWNIDMVNHLWIEESYAKCKIQKLSDPRYTHFPPRTNLGEVIGQTQFDPKVLEALYFSKDPTPSPTDPQPLRRKIMHEKDRNTPCSRNSAEDAVMADQKDGDEQDEEDFVVKPKSKKSALPRTKSRASGSSNFSTPVSRRISAGKENNTPSSTGSRSAKDKALNRLHGMAPDIALYELEKKRKGQVWGGERAANKIEKEKSLERSSSPAAPKDDDNDYSGEEGPAPKKLKTSLSKNTLSTLPPVEIRLLITGYKGWIGNMNKEDVEKKKLRELGILVVQDPATCTHMAAPAMVRTQKFLCALASGPTIVSADFIDACLKDGEIPEMKDFLLKDPASEKKFKLKLHDIVTRAKANKRSLLRRVPVYCTAAIPNGSDTYKAIVEANSGMFKIFDGKPTIKPTNPEDDDGPAEPVYLLTGTRPDERKLWPKFTEMAKAGNMIPRIVSSEWLLDVAMSQQLKWSNVYLAKES